MAITQKLKTFFKEVYVELRKVSWLSRNEVLRYTIIVIIAAVAVAAILGGLDFVFSSILKNIIL